MTARILIVDGVPAAAQEQGGRSRRARLGDAYQAALKSQLPGGLGDLECFILAAGDGIPLPNDFALSDFHGIAWTGSPLSAFEELDAVTAQVDFARAAFRSGVPCFGSCWGLQVMAVALGVVCTDIPAARRLAWRARSPLLTRVAPIPCMTARRLCLTRYASIRMKSVYCRRRPPSGRE